MAGKPLLLYFPAAGRAELCRLVSAAGGLEIDDYFPGLGFKSVVGWFGSMPCVKHGNFSICQSSACAKYFAAIAPNFKDLTPQQVAIDNMFEATLEDIKVGCYKVYFGDAAAQAAAPETIPAHLDKYLSVLETLVPDTGFVNGLDIPTVADMALLNFAEASGPFQDSIDMAGNYDWKTKFPKIKANVERSKEASGVKEYLASSQTMKVQINLGFKASVVANTVGHALSFGLFRGVSLDRGDQPPDPCPPRPTAPIINDTPELVYFPLAGRGELARLISAAGGLELKNTYPGADYKSKVGFFGSMPILKHGSMTICQSSAIESYLATIAPKFKDLTPQQRALDDCFASTKEDILLGCAKIVFGNEEVQKTASVAIPTHLDKFLSVIEEKTPATGFIQGLEFPTTADLVLLNFAEGVMPFQKAIGLAGGYDWQAKFPKIKANVDRTKEVPSIQQYLATTDFMKGTPGSS